MSETKCKNCGKGEIRYPRGLCKPCFQESLTRRLQDLLAKPGTPPKQGRGKK